MAWFKSSVRISVVRNISENAIDQMEKWVINSMNRASQIIRNDRMDHYLEGLNYKASLYIDTKVCSEIRVSWYVIKLKIVILKNLY